MQKFEFSASIQEHDGSSREFRLEFNPIGDNQYQPVITVKNDRTGFSTVNHLPISDYTSLREKVSNLSSMNSEDLKSKVRKIMNLLSLVG